MGKRYIVASAVCFLSGFRCLGNGTSREGVVVSTWYRVAEMGRRSKIVPFCPIFGVDVPALGNPQEIKHPPPFLYWFCTNFCVISSGAYRSTGEQPAGRRLER